MVAWKKGRIFAPELQRTIIISLNKTKMSKKSLKQAIANKRVVALPSRKKGDAEDAVQLYNIYRLR